LGNAENENENVERESSGQFHQRSMRSFYVNKLPVQLFCAYVLGLRKTVAAKAARRTMMILSPVVNFTNVLRAHLRQYSCAKKFKPKL
jgi:hypothetical protein